MKLHKCLVHGIFTNTTRRCPNGVLREIVQIEEKKERYEEKNPTGRCKAQEQGSDREEQSTFTYTVYKPNEIYKYIFLCKYCNDSTGGVWQCVSAREQAV